MKTTWQICVAGCALPAKGLLALFLIGYSQLALAVSTTDCPAEQQAFIEASIDDGISPESRQIMTTPSQREYVRNRVEEFRGYAVNEKIPWHIADANQVSDTKTLQGATEYKVKYAREQQAVLDSFQSKPWRRMADDRFSPWTYQKTIAGLQLEVCFFGVRTRELSGGNISKPTKTAASDCPAQNTEAANRAMDEIDARLGAFSESPVGQQTGTATPVLQVVMWATDAQANIIRQYCPDNAEFKERLAELTSAFNAAQKACRQIQSRPEVCVPAAP
jgi:hypothetical protein